MSQDIVRIGHRGAAGHAPENTLASFQKAIELGVDMVELDVHRTRDKQIVVIHDEKVDRTTNGRGYVNKKTLKELKDLTVEGSEKIPTLAEVLEFLDHRVKVNIELKGKRTIKPVLKIIKRFVQNDGWEYDDFIISTMTRSRLKKVVKAKPKVKVGALLGYRPLGFLSFAARQKVFSIHVHERFLHSKLVQKAHKRGMKVYVWTVNEKDAIKRAVAMGVDGIFSDYPDRLSD